MTKSRTFGAPLAALITGAALALAAAPAGARAPPAAGTPATGTTVNCPWLSTHLTIARRVAMVMSHMTLSDEITMVEGQGTSQPYVFYMAANPRLCIPAMGLEDGPAGVGDELTGVTELPSAVSLAASFDPSLARSYGQAIGAEEAGKGASANLGPTVNIDRDPRWGRSFETYTEDPYLSQQTAVSEIEGVQSQRVLDQVKHYAAYNQETNRNTSLDDVLVSDRTLHEIYLPTFQAAIQKAGAASVMCAYSVINGNFACQDPCLENTVLRDQWNFPGFVTSDYTAIHDTVAAVGGTDMEQAFNSNFGTPLLTAARKGTIARSVLNTMVQRILTEMFRFNLFSDPRTGSAGATVTTPAHVALSNKVAEAGTTLLKNSPAVLPLPASGAGKIAVIGPAASAAPAYAGGGSAYVLPSATVSPLQGITAAAGSGTTVSYTQGLPTDDSLAAIPSSALSPPYAPTPFGGSYTGTLTPPQQITGDSSTLTWATPSDLALGIAQAVAAAKAASTAVVVVSDDTETEAADRPSLDLPSAQNELISAVAAANPHTVVVINAGAPVVMPWLTRVAAVVDAWYPGQTSGTALASVLFGGTDPGGHLPVTFPRNLAQVPAAPKARFPGVNGKVHYSEGLGVGYRWYDANAISPLFPFGFGLSYTTFGYSGLHVSPATVNGTQTVRVTATVTNTGSRSGTDVAQLYLGDPAAAGEPPRQLEGFQRVSLSPGQSTQVTFSLPPGATWWWDQAAGGWTQSTGSYRVYVGDSSALANLPLTGTFAVTATPAARQAVVSAPSRIPAGKPVTVSVRLTASGNQTLHGVRFALQAPQGWLVRPLGSPVLGTVTPGQAPVVKFTVQPPLYAPNTSSVLYATVRLGGAAVRQEGTTVTVTG